MLLYNNKFQKFLGKLQMHWLGPFIVTEIRDSGAVRFVQLDGVLLHGWVNDACLKPFRNPLKKRGGGITRLRQRLFLPQPICGRGKVELVEKQ